MNITKETTISLGTLIAVVPLALWFFTSKADKKDVEKVEAEVDIEENINIEQTTLLKGLTKTVDGLNERINKELAK